MYKDNDILFDIKFNECFYFDPKRDGVAIKNFPNRFRLATDEEKKLYPPDLDGAVK